MNSQVRFDRAEREQLAKMVCRAMTHWQIDEATRCRLLGLSARSKAVLARYREGTPFPDQPDRIYRAAALLNIYKALANLYSASPHLAHRWPTARNQGLKNLSPVEIMLEEGLSGIRRIELFVNDVLHQWSAEVNPKARASKNVNAGRSLLEREELKRATYPTYYTATFDHLETDLGTVIGVSIRYVHSYEQLRQSIEQDFGEFFASGAEIALGLVSLPIAELLIPPAVKKTIDAINKVLQCRSAFYFTAQLHESYA